MTPAQQGGLLLWRLFFLPLEVFRGAQVFLDMWAQGAWGQKHEISKEKKTEEGATITGVFK